MISPDDKDVLEVKARLAEAERTGTTLTIVGGNTKQFLLDAGETPNSVETNNALPITAAGILSYQPSELVITARAGTTLAELRAALDEGQQMLGFEPPSFGEQATIGGTVACSMNGSARPYFGSVRDAILGITLVSGAGEFGRFGGQVMKNVAGYDVSRLLVGSMGSLAVILGVSLRVYPKPNATNYMKLACDERLAFAEIARLRELSLPISGLAFDDDELHIRLAGTEISVQESIKKLPGYEAETGNFWPALGEQQLKFFAGPENLWRASVPFNQSTKLPGKCLWDWGGGLCWLKCDDAELVRAKVSEHHGAVSLFRKSHGSQTSQAKIQISPVQSILRTRIKEALDPKRLLCASGAWLADAP